MRSTRVIAASGLTIAALGLSAGAAFAKPVATTSPKLVGPGGAVTVTVTCDTGKAGRIAASSQGFRSGTIWLHRTHKHGKTYRGTARVASQLSGGPNHLGRYASWGVNGDCPDGKQWFTTFKTDAKQPHGKVHTGVGSTSQDSNTTEIVAGAAVLATAAVGGTYFLRRRQNDQS
ncbi:hypothetical protein A6A06_17200 [Streptomyces sp. CB02923]|uniref:hypothetical protein n=1 Tax=Streptomyces sp. CB02923 TaxID=1718985 RepID=UPI00093AAA06|nr:hypothetical protein [Streptomyces sp. CB02923]OKI00687.1 hypothetical protein A6A06_17200 [Streptomyces sp. CB02923]